MNPLIGLAISDVEMSIRLLMAACCGAGVGMYFVTILTTAIVLAVLQLQKHREVQVEQATARHPASTQPLSVLGPNK